MSPPLVSRSDVHALVDELAEPIDVEELIYRLYVKEKLLRGQQDVAAGRLTPHEELRREVASWRK